MYNLVPCYCCKIGLHWDLKTCDIKLSEGFRINTVWKKGTTTTSDRKLSRWIVELINYLKLSKFTYLRTRNFHILSYMSKRCMYMVSTTNFASTPLVTFVCVIDARWPIEATAFFTFFTYGCNYVFYAINVEIRKSINSPI